MVNGQPVKNSSRFVRLALIAAAVMLLPRYVFAVLPAPSLVGPVNLSTGVSQTPTMTFFSVAGTTVQYWLQIAANENISPTVYDLNQVSAQSYAKGKFSVQDATISVAGDAYYGASTASFTFFSGQSYPVPLSPNTQYWYKVCVSSNSGTEYSAWTATRTFTTGEFASQSPIDNC